MHVHTTTTTQTLLWLFHLEHISKCSGIYLLIYCLFKSRTVQDRKAAYSVQTPFSQGIKETHCNRVLSAAERMNG